MHPTEQLLAAYMDQFYGYGTYRGDWWLVGMEEGGGRPSGSHRRTGVR